MKTQEAALQIGLVIYNKPGINPKEIYAEVKDNIPMPQVYSALKLLADSKHVTVTEGADKVKTYKLTNAGEMLYKHHATDNDVPKEEKETDEHEVAEEGITVAEKPSNDKKEVETGKMKKTEPTKTVGRDLTKYTFNGIADLNKGRLALAVIRHIAFENPKIKMKELLEVFPDALIPPYGLIKPLKEALEISPNTPRFFIKEDEVIKIGYEKICVSNQFTKDRIDQFIAIAAKEYKVKITVQK